MVSKAGPTDEKTVRYLLSVIKSCADFQPDFAKVAEDFDINTSRPRADALVPLPFASQVLVFLYFLQTLRSNVHRIQLRAVFPRTATDAETLRCLVVVCQYSDFTPRWSGIAREFALRAPNAMNARGDFDYYKFWP
jgi:hypothetical protein